MRPAPRPVSRRLRVVETPQQAAKVRVTARGYGAAYHPGEANRCPGCGKQHWHVGRSTAECAFCGCALPIVDDGRQA